MKTFKNLNTKKHFMIKANNNFFIDFSRLLFELRLF